MRIQCSASHRSGVALSPNYLNSNGIYQLILVDISITCHRVIRRKRYLLCKLRFC